MVSGLTVAVTKPEIKKLQNTTIPLRGAYMPTVLTVRSFLVIFLVVRNFWGEAFSASFHCHFSMLSLFGSIFRSSLPVC